TRSHLSDVARDLTPSLDLAVIVETSAAEGVGTEPLKTAARALLVDPTLPAPHLERLRCSHPEVIQRRVVAVRGEFRLREPPGREFLSAIGHVLAAEHA